jgi:uncharacterized protein YbaP (TraB family)
MRAVLLTCLLLGCQGDHAKARAAGSGTDPRAVAAAGSGTDPWAIAAAGSGSDPWAGTANAEDPPSLAERHRLADEACPTVKAPFFFRVEKAGHVDYLLGTYHISVPFSKFPPYVHDTLDHATRVVFELPPDAEHEPFNDDKVSIQDALGPVLWKHYRELVGASVAERNTRASPMVAAIQLALLYADPSALLEDQMQDEIRPLGIPMDGLETSDFQHDVLVKLFDIKLLRAIVASIKDRTELRDDNVRSLRAYCDGTKGDEVFNERDRKAMHGVGYTDADIAGFENMILYDRNVSWIPKLEQLFGRDGVVVAVGAGHLRGPKGVPALLEAKGYAVSRVTQPPK